MRIERAYRTELKVNNKQRARLRQHAGTARFAWNWGLQRKNEAHAMNQLPVPHIKRCHLRIDRDLNAAINLSRLAVSSTESENACLRREVAGPETARCPSVIQGSDSDLSSDGDRFV